MTTNRCYVCGAPREQDQQRCAVCTAALVLKKWYRIERVLGKGGFSTVYQATHIQHGHKLAIKEIAVTSVQHRAQIEAEATVLHHTAIKLGFMPRISHKWSENGRAYLVMEYIEGPTLDELLSPPWSPPQIMQFLATLLDHLARLHDEQVLHRDLKPANIKRRTDGSFVLLDFGIAQRGSSTAMKAGSIEYAPLEQLQGQPADARSDLFSLGATAYHLLTGSLPPNVAMRQGTGTGPRPPSHIIPNLPPVLDALLLHLLELDPADRPPDARIALRQLRQGAPFGRTRSVLPTSRDVISSVGLPTQQWTSVSESGAPQPVLNVGGPTRILTLPLDNLSRPTHNRPANLSDPDGRSFQTSNRIKGVVWSLAFSPDGSSLASGHSDHTLRTWNVSTGSAIRTLTGHTNQPRCVAFSSDGTLLISGSEDTTIRCWRVVDGRCLHTLRANAPIRSIAISPDGLMVASGAYDGTVNLWRIADGRLIETTMEHRGEVRSIVFSPDGALLATGSSDSTAALWHVDSGTRASSLRVHVRQVRSVAFSPDGRRLASCAYDNVACVWDARAGTLLQTLSANTYELRNVAFLRDGTLVATETVDGVVKLWRMNDANLLRTLTGNTREVRCMALSPDAAMIASGSYDNAVRLWRL